MPRCCSHKVGCTPGRPPCCEAIGARNMQALRGLRGSPFKQAFGHCAPSAAGSRLPLPPDWALAEVPLPPAEAGVAADAGTAAGGALALMLGWEEQGLAGWAASPVESTADAAAAAAAEQKLRSAVLLLFGEQREASPGVVPGAAGAEGQAEEPPVWRDPVARWCLAALMDRYAPAAGAELPSAASGSSAVDTHSWQQQEARQLAEHFAAASYGDRLFGASVALLLRQAVPLDTQVRGRRLSPTGATLPTG